MTLERTEASGMTIISEFVTDGLSEWLETQRYMGYTDAEARALYAEHLRREGLRLTD